MMEANGPLKCRYPTTSVYPDITQKTTMNIYNYFRMIMLSEAEPNIVYSFKDRIEFHKKWNCTAYSIRVVIAQLV